MLSCNLSEFGKRKKRVYLAQMPLNGISILRYCAPLMKGMGWRRKKWRGAHLIMPLSMYQWFSICNHRAYRAKTGTPKTFKPRWNGDISTKHKFLIYMFYILYHCACTCAQSSLTPGLEPTGLPYPGDPPPGELPDPGIKSTSPMSPSLQVDSLSHQGLISMIQFFIIGINQKICLFYS